jgi:hypothetical protein
MKTLEQLLSEKWRKRDGSVDQKMVDFCMKDSIYVQSGEEFINCGDAKPRIENTMWYDDETKGPEVNFESFKSYNMRNAPRTVEEQMEVHDRKPYITNNYYLRDGETTTLLKSVVFRNENYDRMTGEERLATEDEMQLVKLAINKARRDYEKRLERYWKRYENKVKASGYWANR